MLKYIIKRIISIIPVIIIISMILFGVMKLMPGDPAARMIPLPEGAAGLEQYQLELEVMREKLGLNKPIPIQYALWIANTVQGNFGYSTMYKQEVRYILGEPLRNSIILNVFSITCAFLISIPVGIKSAVKRFSAYDTGWQVFSLVGISMPTFFFGIFLIYVVALKLGWLPSGGMPTYPVLSDPTLTPQDITALKNAYTLSWLRYIILPVMTLTIGSLAGTVRYVRNAMLEVIRKDFIRTARSKGLSEKVVIYSHAFRNALIPVVTIVAGSLVGLFGGSAITETVFAWHGIGRVLIAALTSADYSIVLTMNLFYASLSLLANLIMDISYAFVDPRVKLD